MCNKQNHYVWLNSQQEHVNIVRHLGTRCHSSINKDRGSQTNKSILKFRTILNLDMLWAMLAIVAATRIEIGLT